jgi:precorrin-8X/cobalt-precorrin-8 methylmutase
MKSGVVAAPPPRRYAYETDGDAIYERSFAIIRQEADLSLVPLEAHSMAVRMIHSCGDVSLGAALRISPHLVRRATEALRSGCTIFTDSEMLAAGIMRRQLGEANRIVCTLNDERATRLAVSWRTTRAAAAVSLWEPHLAGSLVAIGNAPTALFHLLELLHSGAPRPAVIIGVPVGFVGAAEAKAALAENPFDIPYAVAEGRRGGSAMAASAVNALARESKPA